jgi:hypothetical protein
MEDAKHRSVELGLSSDGAHLTHSLARLSRSEIQRHGGAKFIHKVAIASTPARFASAKS